ncbi:MAG TPA: hypothetical protein PK304_07525 [Mobilitalea sp.]|nr:hypothetical protein [Mobilitalea sp.]
MGLFGNKVDRQEQLRQQVQMTINKYGLSDLDERYIEAITEIITSLVGASSILHNGTAVDNVKMSYLNNLINQNWIIIRQLDEISKKLDNIK